MKTLIRLLPLLFLAACDHEAQLTYKVTNRTDAAVKVISTNNHSGTGVVDTAIIPAGEQSDIAVNGQGINKVKKYKEEGENLRSFLQMDIYRDDTMKAKADFLKTGRWVYEEQSAYLADYVLAVQPSDF